MATNLSAKHNIACLILLAWQGTAAAEDSLTVASDKALRDAIARAQPGTHIRIKPGDYRPGVYVTNLHGTKDQPIVIEGSQEDAPPQFSGGKEGWHVSDCNYLVIRNVSIRGCSANGINVDDGGTYDTPSHHIVLAGISVEDIGPRGNFDGIKLSGLQDFAVRDCRVSGWGGQAIDLVGCHRGIISSCELRGKQGFSQTTGFQIKGGSSEIVVRHCRMFDAGARALNIGGSTGLQFFRPQGTKYEAKDIVVEGCTIAGSEAPLAFVGVDGAMVRMCTIYRPRKWVFRILQETREPGFVACRNGVMENNLIVFRADELSRTANIGPATSPQSFRFHRNLWYCEDRPEASQPALPSKETAGVYGFNPRLKSPKNEDFSPQTQIGKGFGATSLPQSDY